MHGKVIDGSRFGSLAQSVDRSGWDSAGIYLTSVVSSRLMVIRQMSGDQLTSLRRNARNSEGVRGGMACEVRRIQNTFSYSHSLVR